MSDSPKSFHHPPGASRTYRRPAHRTQKLRSRPAPGIRDRESSHHCRRSTERLYTVFGSKHAPLHPIGRARAKPDRDTTRIGRSVNPMMLYVHDAGGGEHRSAFRRHPVGSVETHERPIHRMLQWENPSPTSQCRERSRNGRFGAGRACRASRIKSMTGRRSENGAVTETRTSGAHLKNIRG